MEHLRKSCEGIINYRDIAATCVPRSKSSANPHPKWKPFSISYFGGQTRFASEIMRFVPDTASKYIDIVAGGMGTPYQLAYNRKLPIVVNDLGYYSYICGRAVFEENSFARAAMDKELRNDIIWDAIVNVNPEEGHVYKEMSKIINPDICRHVDGFLTVHAANPLLIAAIAKALFTTFTFRGLAWAKSTPEKLASVEYPMELYFKKLWRMIEEFCVFNTALEVRGECFWSDANDFVKAYKGFEGACVYMDPAWPWMDSSSATSNPYKFSSETLPKLLLRGEPLKGFLPWNSHDEAKILSDVGLWVRSALDGGAQRVIVNTQDTNFPAPSRVGEFLHDTFAGFEVSDMVSWSARTKQAKKGSFGERLWTIDQV